MSVPSAGRTHLVLVGTTGMVGGYVLRYALEHPAVERVTAIGRRTLGISHAKLVEVLRPNFGDCSALAESLSHQDAAIFCLGAYSGAVPDAEFRAITVDYVVEFTRVLHSSSPHAGFAFLSGKGADPTGKSRIAFARYKGEAENALLTAGFPAVYIFRPAYIYPVEPRTEPNFGYRLLRAIYPVFRVLFPSNPSRRFGTGDDRCRTTSSGGPQRIGVREQRYPGHGREASPPHRVRRHRDIVEMDSAILSTTSALVGGVSTLAASWFTQRGQLRAQALVHESVKRETLYAEFIIEAYKCFSDAWSRHAESPGVVAHLYSVVQRMRLTSSDEVISVGEKVIRLVIEAYAASDKTFDELRERVAATEDQYDPLREFSEVCRVELLALRR